jgi:hypothetical protein
MNGAKTADAGYRLPALEIDNLVQSELTRLLRSDTQFLDLVQPQIPTAAEVTILLSTSQDLAKKLETSPFVERKSIVCSLVRSVVISSSKLTIDIDVSRLLEMLVGVAPEERAHGLLMHSIVLPVALRRRGVELKLVLGGRVPPARVQNPGLGSLLGKAHRLLNALTDRSGITIADLAKRERLDVSDLSRLLRFAFLAPDITQAITDGRQPVEWTAHHLLRLPELPYVWADQRKLLNL